MSRDKPLTKEQETELISILKKRFEKNSSRHPDLDWKIVEEKLIHQPEKLWSINEMEISGGEPDVIYLDENLCIYFVDCSP